jgi:cytoskeletal protein CcmA (bactofilin family)
MWKKTESEANETPRPATVDLHRQPTSEKAVIGSSLILKGDLSGEEDLIIQGQVDGKIILKNNSVTVGRNGRVKADVYGKSVYVEGTLKGNLYGEEKVVIRQSGNVRGNISAPRVSLEDGAKFKGSIDMEGAKQEKQRTFSGLDAATPVVKKPEKPAPAPAPAADRTPVKTRTKEEDSDKGGLGRKL